jgi:hypothetical protein
MTMMRPVPLFSGRISALLILAWGMLVWRNWLISNPVSFVKVKTALAAFGRIDWSKVPLTVVGHLFLLAGLLVLSLAALGAGRGLVLFLKGRGSCGGLLARGALGAGALSLSVLGLGFAGLAYPGPFKFLAALAALYGGCQIISLVNPRKTTWRLESEWYSAGALWLIAGIALALFIAWTGALTPPRAYDAIFHHLAHPQIFAAQHKVIALPHHFLSYYPALLEMQYLLAFLLGGSWQMAKLVHFIWGLFVMAVLFRWSRESLPVSWALAGLACFLLIPMCNFLSCGPTLTSVLPVILRWRYG